MELKTSTSEDKILAAEMERFKKGVDIISDATKIKTYRELLVMCYQHEINKGLVPIEKLEQVHKDQLWAMVKKDTAGLNKEHCIEMAKIFYLTSSKI